MKSHKTVLEKNIEKIARRIKKADESSAPAVFRSNKLLDELQKENLEAQLAAVQQGRPTGEAQSSLAPVFRAMGLERFDFPEWVDESTYAEYKPIIERLGFPEKCCERSVSQIAMCDIAELPKPHIMVNTGQSCDPHKFDRRSLANFFNIPVFYIDVPLNEEDKRDLNSLNYIVNQLGEFIEWAEKKVPGIKYDKDRHIEILEMSAIGEKYLRETYQLIKHVPCPIAPLDKYQKRMVNFFPSRFPNMQKANEYLRICRDELGERVASGQGPFPEERLRLLWSGESPQEVFDVGRLLLERKVAMPMHVGGHTSRFTGLGWHPIGEVSEYGVILSPLQEVARDINCRDWGGPGKRWVNITVDLARDIGAHGIINYLVIGCTSMRGMGSLIAERAEKELGIPVLNIEGRVKDQDYMTQGQFEEILSPFIDKCFDWAGKPRQ